MQRSRTRDLGLRVGILNPGPYNAITDVAGVRVGHKTIVRDDDIRTGVTAIIPHEGNLFQEKVPAAIYVGNGFGKLVGSTQIEELGTIETPILLTNTLSVFIVADALIDYMLQQPGNENVFSINPVVGETNDGFLNHIQKRSISRQDVWDAITSAQSGQVVEGSVGAGTGTICFSYKGGIGTASRLLPASLGGYTVGVLVQTNFGGVLEINGAPVGRELGRYYLKNEVAGDGSCMIVVATDAPLSVRNLKRLAKRALLGLAKTGGFCANGSGDYVIAFSTDPACRVAHSGQGRTRHYEEVRDDQISPIFLAVVEATQEAIYNSLFMAQAMIGWQGHNVDAIPLDRVVEICKKYHVIK
ncbi:MAG: P1 family peptidase [candidate division KSB1 bacterium]|nr:P1 family peptidase [candidate division KSB1 bacterium]MDZ7317789.1 P1 family peptidase [candidate division KSB1 bacterium]MDZ7341680.1 P1 family peptidase [candidate division KSB1 bacterium]